ncbi:MAG: hypothetical protein IJM85_00230 [Clostridia bacterium]|nr:hypothetical protein [Clostridia bacterium]
MNERKFTVNSLVLIVMIFSLALLFFTVNLVTMAEPYAENSFYRIEGTKYYVHYSTMDPSGIYLGSGRTAQLMIEGEYGHDWGAVAVGDKLYINEYSKTDFGIMLTRLVCIDLTTFEKTVLRNDTMLRGRCRSGELVAVSGFVMPSNMPDTNSLCKMYSFSKNDIHLEDKDAVVLYIDPETAAVVHSVRDKAALEDDFESRFIETTLEEAAQ